MKNTIADAQAIATQLRALQFDVQDFYDLDFNNLLYRMTAFLKVEPGEDKLDAVLIYYAGHGIQLGDKNYIVPKDFNPHATYPLAQLVSVQMLLERMDAKADKKILFLDACRDSGGLKITNAPPVGAVAAARAEPVSQVRDELNLVDEPVTTRSLSANRGLARPSLRHLNQTFIAFAADPGEKALDGPKDGNSPFTSGVLSYIDRRGFDIFDMCQCAARDVRKETNGAQVPWTHYNLMEQFEFHRADRWPQTLLALMGVVAGVLTALIGFDLIDFGPDGLTLGTGRLRPVGEQPQYLLTSTFLGIALGIGAYKFAKPVHAWFVLLTTCAIYTVLAIVSRLIFAPIADLDVQTQKLGQLDLPTLRKLFVNANMSDERVQLLIAVLFFAIVAGALTGAGSVLAGARFHREMWRASRVVTGAVNQLADANKIDIITLRINGGYTGLADQRAQFERAWAIWGNGSAPQAITNSDFIERGQRGEDVKVVQQLLVKTGYFPADEKIDGVFGGNTMKKVAEFQYNYNKTAAGPQKLNVSGSVDKKTLAALQAAPASERRRRSAPAIPKNARDPRQLGQPPATPGPDRRHGTPAAPDRLPGILQLAGVIMVVMALATIIVGGFSDNGLRFPVPPLILAGLGVLSFIYASHRAALSGPRIVVPSGSSRPVDPWVNPTGEYVPPVVQTEIEPATMTAPAVNGDNQLPDLTAPLHEFGFSDSDFEDSEPIRYAPGLAADVSLSDRPAIDVPLPEIVPEDDLEVPGAPDKRNAFGATRSPKAAAFNVSVHDVPLVLIMMFGGDNNLSHQVTNDLNEIAAGIRAGRGMAAVIALADIENAPASVIEVTPAGDQRTITQLGEIDTGDPDTLATFVSRALATYPQARKAIGFWDHGTGVFDEFDDNEVLLTRSLKPRKQRRAQPARRLLIPASQRAQLNTNPTTRGMLHDSTGGILTNVEAGRMLRAAFYRAGQTAPVDLIYSDTCLNGMIEVLEELGAYAQCVVASSDTEPGAGWDYESWIGSAGRNFPSTPALWAQSAVRSFSDRYRDDVDQHPCTLAAFQADNQIAETFARLVEAAKPSGMAGWNLLTTARGYAQSYDRRDAFDLIDFAQQLHGIAKTLDPAIAAAAADLDKACRDARIDNAAHGAMVTGAKGLAFWFPSSRRNLEKDLPTYRMLKFAQLTGWADYLESQYGGGV